MKKVEIKGTYKETGFKLGEIQRDILKSIEEKVINSIKVENEKIKKFEECLKKFDFLEEEIQSYCQGADIKFENLLKLKLGNFEIPKISCTSLFLDSEFIEENVKVAMKIRDQLPLPQYICKKQNYDKTPYFFSGSISDIGYGFFIKEDGFFGINNTGSPLKDKFVSEYGFDDCDIMRIVAETCNQPGECIEIIKKMQKEKIVGCAGKKRGMIFLFGNMEKIIMIELNSFELCFKEIKSRVCFTNEFILSGSENWIQNLESNGVKSSRMRKKRLEEIWDENIKLNLEKLIEISRDKKYYPYSICRDSFLMPVRTVSVFIIQLICSPLLWLCLGQPYTSPFFPFHIKGNKIIDKFISGEISFRLNKIFEDRKLEDNEFLEKIRNFEGKLKIIFEKIKNIEEKNLTIQEEVVKFINCIKNRNTNGLLTS